MRVQLSFMALVAVLAATAPVPLGDRQGAVADFRKALELQPGLQTARDALQKLEAL